MIREHGKTRASMRIPSLQERYAPTSVCFGCGPANVHGLKIRSMVEGDSVVARWTPKAFHHAFGKFLNGGIISTILDCHSNWASAYSLMLKTRAEGPPSTVTSSIFVEFLRPTPIGPLFLEAKVQDAVGRNVVTESTLKASDEVTARLRGTFVAVRAQHPAAGRWAGQPSRPTRIAARLSSRLGASGEPAIGDREEHFRHD
jgi:acyl-coenzyme A thioesterase PaaI-like protein